MPTNTATFSGASPTSIVVSNNATINTIEFTAGAPAYSFTIQSPNNLIVQGAGIINSSSNAPSFTTDAGASLFFFNGTAANAVFTNNGTMGFFNASTAATATITTTGLIDFLNTSSADTATITVNGGALGFRDTSTAANATIVNNATVLFIDSSTAGNAVVTTNSGATTAFQTNASGGQARFITNAGGTFDMSGLTSGGTTAGSIEGAGNYVLGTNTLTVGSNNLSTEVSGVISGSAGSLTKVGNGTLTLSGINTYGGNTSIDAGALVVNGSIATSVLTSVNSTATLTGIGTVGSLQVNGGGTFIPGNGTPGTSMTVAGNLTVQPGAQYSVFVNPTTSSFSTVTGTATLNGGTVNAVFSPGTYFARQYLILDSAGLTGTFAGLTNTNLPGGFDVFLSYTADDAFLNLIAALGVGTPLNVNQQNVANAINNFFNNNNGTVPPGFGSLFNLSGADLANALSQLSGEVATGAERSAFNLTTQFLNLLTDPYASCSVVDPRDPNYCRELRALGFAPEQQASLPPAIALAYNAVLKAPVLKAPPLLEQRWTAWGSAFGGVNRAKGDQTVIGSHDVTASDWGFAAGMDYHYSPGTLLGFALAGAGTNWDLAQGLGNGRSDAFMAGVRGRTHVGPLYLAGAFSFADHWFTIDRTSFAGDQLRSNFNGQSYGGRLEGGYRFAFPFGGGAVGISPYAAVQSQWFHTPTYSESDLTGGGFGLTYNGMTANDTRGELGARFDSLTRLYGNPLILRARLAWAHDWVDNPALNAAFQALPGSAFTVFGAPIPHNSALTSASAELHFSPNWSFTAKFDGEFASDSQTYAGTGTLRYTW